ncbi:MAG: hypothetical protein IPM81_20220 [Saprospirales bacterium]|nr:hypothetical protein [Saprospirales bacterium]
MRGCEMAPATRTYTLLFDGEAYHPCNQETTISDNTLPAITRPDNITVECEDEVPGLPGQPRRLTSLPGASASDNCDDNLTYACTTGPLTGGASRGHDHAGTQSDG